MALPLLLAALLLGGSALLPADARTLAALLAIILLGVPHGALDGEIARDVLRPRLGWAWFLAFSTPYLFLCAVVLLAWHFVPLATLAGFLAASVWHFGSEDAECGALLEKIVRGGLPIAAPALLHPAATALLFTIVSGQQITAIPIWWEAGALAWVGLLGCWTVRTTLDRGLRPLIGPAILVVVFTALPPLTAFAVYFVCVHAPAHTASLIRNPHRGYRVRDARSALLLALPICALTLGLGAVLWPFYVGSVPTRLLSLTIQGLSALTLPHMLLDAWTTRRETLTSMGDCRQSR